MPAPYHTGNGAVPARVVFESGRGRPFGYSVGAGVASMVFLGWSGAVQQHLVRSLVLFLVAAGLGVLALGALWTAMRPKSVIEVSGQGIVVLRPGRRVQVDWHQIAKVRVEAGVGGRPWLVVWPRAGVPGLGSGESGMRLAPVAPWASSGRRSKDVADLRVALAWYGGSTYDPTP